MPLALLTVHSMCVYTLMVGIASAAIYSVLLPISEATGLTLADLNAGTGYMFLAFGWGCLFWQPIALNVSSTHMLDIREFELTFL